VSGPFCDVCGTGTTVGVFCVPMVAMSVAYCQQCIDANAHPWDIVVGNTACIGSLDQANDEWREIVECTCRHLKRTMAEFNAAVTVSAENLDRAFEAMEEAREKTGDEDPFGLP